MRRWAGIVIVSGCHDAITVSPPGDRVWIEACDARLPVVDGRAQLPAPLTPCARRAVRDDGGAVVRSRWEPSATHLSLPTPGHLGTPGFTVVRRGDVGVLVPYDLRPHDEAAPHPAWFTGAAVVGVDDVAVTALPPHALHDRVLGSPGSVLHLTVQVPVDLPLTWPLAQHGGATFRIPFVRQAPDLTDHPSDAASRAWLARVDWPVDDVTAAMETWRTAPTPEASAAGPPGATRP